MRLFSMLTFNGSTGVTIVTIGQDAEGLQAFAFLPDDKSFAACVFFNLTTTQQSYSTDRDVEVARSKEESGEQDRDQFDDKPGGICNAYCEGVNCDEYYSKKSCGFLADNFVKFGGPSTVECERLIRNHAKRRLEPKHLM